MPSLALSLEAQSSFQPIREQWLLSTKLERAALKSQLEAFSRRYPQDPLARVADVYLAFIALDSGKDEEAVVLARRIRQGPMGSTRDLGRLVDGAFLAHDGKPEAALRLLDPLVGKLIDAFAQDLLHEAVTTAAVDAHRWYQAVVYMNEWLRSTNDQDLPAVRAKVDALLVRFPPGSLESALRAMAAARQQDLWERELRKAIAARLAAVAVEHSDPSLARSILETSRTVVGLGNAGTSLAQLATSGGRAPRIVGARVGLVVDTSGLRAARSAEAVAGALQVFAPHRSMTIDLGTPQAEPPALVTGEVPPGGSLRDALDELAYSGAAVIIAGHDGKRASEAAAYAEAQSIPILLLVEPEQMPAGARFSFVVGTGEPRWTHPLSSQAAAQVNADHAVRVARGVAPKHPLAASCKRRPARAAETTFPVGVWREAKAAAVAIDGPTHCARIVLADLRSIGFAPTVFLGLEAREAVQPYGGELRVASTGFLDADPASEPESMLAWRTEHGKPPTWFEALGRDAALLAHDAVAGLPRDTFTSLDAVMQRRAQAQQALLRTDSKLWTTRDRGFGGRRVLRRTVLFEPRRR